MAGFTIQAQVEGLKEGIAKMRELAKPGKVNAILRPAMKKADKVILEAAKTNVRALSFKDSLGLLLKSLGSKEGVTRRGVVFGATGPRVGYKANRKTGIKSQTALGKRYEAAGRDPVKYAHLIEMGVQPHAIGKGDTLERKRKGGLRAAIQSGHLHPGFAGRPFMRPALEKNRTAVTALLASEIGKGIEKLAQG